MWKSIIGKPHKNEMSVQGNKEFNECLRFSVGKCLCGWTQVQEHLSDLLYQQSFYKALQEVSLNQKVAVHNAFIQQSCNLPIWDFSVNN